MHKDPELLKAAKKQRKWLPAHLEINSWEQVELFYSKLFQAQVASSMELKHWLQKRSELDAALEEEKAWRYIDMSCSCSNEKLTARFEQFSKEIEPKVYEWNNKLDKKLFQILDKVDPEPDYSIFLRQIKTQLEIFREENISLLSDLEIEEQKYGAIAGSMTILHEGEEQTLQQAQNYLKEASRELRKEVFEKIWNRRAQDYSRLNELMSDLVQRRTTIAQNSGFKNYIEFRFAQLGRFDYTLIDCQLFYESIRDSVSPILEHFHEQRKTSLQLDSLQAYDLEVDISLKPALKPFNSVQELIDKSIACFEEIDPDFGSFLKTMDANGYMDLESRKGKSPGGYNYPLYESNVPFIFMNATNNLRDLETMMHEGGHAIHSFLSKDLPLVYYKELTAEIAELASMSMELISMEHWHHFFESDEDLRRAKRSQLEGIIQVLPWVASIDRFQDWLYTHPEHSINERLEKWVELDQELNGSSINWDNYPEHRKHSWQKQIHLFQFPLYYVEYGIAQLGAVAIWKNYKKDPASTIQQYKAALSLGYSKTLPELYEAAGIQFDFSKDYIKKLMEFVLTEIESLD